MNRRGFFKAAALLLGAATVTPNVLFAKSNSKDTAIKTKKLKVRWSKELAQDLLAFHGIDADKEIKTMVKFEIDSEIKEIDGKILRIVEQTAIDKSNFIPHTEYIVEYI